MDEDTAAFNKVMMALAMPKETDEQKAELRADSATPAADDIGEHNITCAARDKGRAP